MSLYPLTDAPVLSLRLAVVYRFRDIFTNTPVRTRLTVSIPSRKWTAYASPSDGTYRFVEPLTGAGDTPVPRPFDVLVESDTGDYANYEPFQVELPRTVPPGPPQVSSYLIEKFLWPTRRFRPPPGETAVVGRVTSDADKNVAGLKVYLYTQAGPDPPAGTPYTYTDGNGDFLYRLPKIKAQLDGTGNVVPVTLNARVFDGALAVTIDPIAIPNVAPGSVIFQQFQ
jgi:hypothetical protein